MCWTIEIRFPARAMKKIFFATVSTQDLEHTQLPSNVHRGLFPRR
jgi:hypothetical protein